jgi:hypothetical protein
MYNLHAHWFVKNVMIFWIFCCTSAVQKDTDLFLIYCCTYNLIRLVSFKVLPSTVDTPLPAFFPVLERVLQDGAKVL